MRYQKPHLSYDDQLKLLRARGVIIDNWDESLSALRYYGYYRLSGYFYPFRQILPKEERQSPTNFRKEDFNPETHFNYAINLANFDSRLRKILFEGLEMAEIAIRTKIVYEAGKVDPYIHVNQDLLDIEACARLISTNPEVSEFDYWQKKYRELLSQAKNEDFFRHFAVKYEGNEFPIWIAAEFFDFGAITRLFGLLPKKVQNRVAQSFGVVQGNSFKGWIRRLNLLRNNVAHHNRLWNRRLVLGFKKLPPSQVHALLHHFSKLERTQLNHLYEYLAVLTLILRHTDQGKNWNRRVKEIMNKVPHIPNFSVETQMGFPGNWRELDLWK